VKGFRFTLPYSVRISDINYGGHVSNAALLNYFQDARIAYLARLGPFSELDIGEGLGLILPEARVLYRAEMFLGDVLEIGVRVESVGRTSFAMGYRVERQGTVTSEGTTALVAFDYACRKPRRVPRAFREAVAALEGFPAET
jgi:acyl-CoA thioester hydrolase